LYGVGQGRAGRAGEGEVLSQEGVEHGSMGARS
jgi:hypothetical protein